MRMWLLSTKNQMIKDWIVLFGRRSGGPLSPWVHVHPFSGYFDSQTMSLSLYDGSFYSGTLDSNIVTFPDSGDWVGLDWVGQITKPKIEDCFQNKLDEYCRNLGVKDNYPVEGEAGLKFLTSGQLPVIL